MGNSHFINQILISENHNSNIKMTERYAKLARQHIARTGNTLIVPSNMADISSLIAGAMSVVKSQNAG